jgi:integrase
MKRRGLGMVFQRGSVWWVQYYWRGKRYRETSGSIVRMEAVKLLRKRLSEMGMGQLHGPDLEKTTFDDLAIIIGQEYKANARKSIIRMQTGLKPLRLHFETFLARDITFDRLNSYIATRLASDIAPASVRYELSVLRRAFRLAQKAGKAICPPFPTLSVHNTRTGFFEREDFEAVLTHLPPEIRPIMIFAYLTGWRTRSEILPLTWRQVDLTVGTVRLEPGATKNDEARVLPFGVLPELAELLRTQWNKTMEIQIETGSIIPWVFHRHGKPIKDFYGAWKVACRKAGVPQRIPHDFRRTAVRNLERAGVPRSVAMKITGHKTEAVYRRYAIVSEADLSEGLKKLAKLHSMERAQRQNQFLATEQPQSRDEMGNLKCSQSVQPVVSGAGDRDRTGTGL